ncbi:succinylglutamate desuccinylase [Aestuariirhabdus sp. LZHN29]|uniref:succinylglutamate desuccinylase n=1 Tax=Aestuariirhabdus sp. LZHN29 TaxID=3417462 RepID=UPI003CF2967B
MSAATAPLLGSPDFSFLQHCLDDANASRRERIERHGVTFSLIDEGVLQIEPQEATTSLVLSAGVHGNETAPIELIERLLQQLFDGHLQLHVRLLLILGNPPAMRCAERFVDTNLNRLFNPEPLDGSGYEHKRARQLMSHLDHFFCTASGARLHYDLHTAIRDSEYEKFAVYPHNNHPQPWSKPQLQLLAGAGIEAVLFQDRPSPTFSWYSSNVHGAHAFTLELGKVRGFGENDPLRLQAIEKSLAALIEGCDPQTQPLASLKLFRIRDQIIRRGEQFELLFPDDLPNFSRFMPGSLLSRDDDACYTLTGTPGYIIFPNARVEIGARAALIAEAVEVDTLFPETSS